MGTISNSKFTLDYGEAIMFRWSPCILTITRTSNVLESVTITISDNVSAEDIAFTMQFGGVGNVLRFDISRALQSLGGSDIDVMVAGGGETTRVSVLSINGSRGIKEPYGGTYSIRQWQYLPLSITFLYYGDTELEYTDGDEELYTQYESSSESGYELATYTVPAYTGAKKTITVEGQVYDNTGGWETSDWAYKITPSCKPSRPSIYLRWLDNQGLTWYWLFEIYDVDVEVDSDVEYSRMPVAEENAINEWESASSKIVRKTIKIGANDITTEEYKVIKTLATSAIVDAKSESGGWYRVRVANGTTAEAKGNYKEVEFTIELAPTKTQMP